MFRALIVQGRTPCLSFVLPVCVAGLTWEECIAQCPQGVVPACHNAEDTVTISGPQVSRFPGFSSSLNFFLFCWLVQFELWHQIKVLKYSTSLLYLSFMYHITHVIAAVLNYASCVLLYSCGPRCLNMCHV